MRCFAIAQAWARRGGKSVFFLSESLPALAQRILSAGFEIVPLSASTAEGDVQSLLEFRRKYARSWVVLDGYAFTAQHQQLLLDAGFRVMVVDDYGQTDSYPADIVLNQNIYAAAEGYEKTYRGRAPNTRLLLGSDYALLRAEFLPWSRWTRSINSNASRLLITLGGSDAANRSLDVLRALSSFAEFEIVLLVGGTAQADSALETEAARIINKVKIVLNTSDMPGWMAWADIAIAGAGVTSYELCFMGLPSLLMVLADNQRPIANRLAEMGVAMEYCPHGTFEAAALASVLQNLAHSKQRGKMSQSARQLVDGLGADRGCAAMLDYASTESV